MRTSSTVSSMAMRFLSHTMSCQWRVIALLQGCKKTLEQGEDILFLKTSPHTMNCDNNAGNAAQFADSARCSFHCFCRCLDVMSAEYFRTNLVTVFRVSNLLRKEPGRNHEPTSPANRQSSTTGTSSGISDPPSISTTYQQMSASVGIPG